ncbi:MAG: hypothetical protein ABJA90_11345 [Ginsengibacter sp.]
MKKVSKVLVVFIMFSTLAFTAGKPSIVGKWTVYSHGDSLTATFNADGTYTANSPTGEEAASGKYMETDDTFAINDENCGSTWGKYKITYYGEDSLDLKVITDSCADRMEAVNGITAKRIKDQ